MNDQDIVSRINEQGKDRTVTETVMENRKQFRLLVEEYYSERLKLEPGKAALSKLDDRDAVLLEASHGAQLPHLGIYRLYVKGGDIAARARSGLLVFFVGDQYSADMYPEINRIKIPIAGKVREKTLQIPVENKHKPVRLLPPPAEKAITGVSNKIIGSMGSNLGHFLAEHNMQKHEIDKDRFSKKLNEVTEIMVESANAVETYADWCVRAQLVILKKTNPELYEKSILFYPIWDTRKFGKAWQRLVGMQKDMNDYESRISGKPVDPEQSRIWYYCSCGARARGRLKSGGNCECSCEACGSVFEAGPGSEASSPEIVFSQVLTPLYLGIAGRVVGHVHPYARVADSFLKDKLGQAPPERFVLSSHPVFHGIGDPKEGDSRCSLVRAAIEADYPDIGAALVRDWSEDPHIRTYFEPVSASKGDNGSKEVAE